MSHLCNTSSSSKHIVTVTIRNACPTIFILLGVLAIEIRLVDQRDEAAAFDVLTNIT